MTKQIIEENIGQITICECTIDELMAELQNFKNRCQPGQNIKLVPDGGYEGYYDYQVMCERLETDEEYQMRIDNERKELFKKNQKKMESLLKKKDLSQSEKDQLIDYIMKK